MPLYNRGDVVLVDILFTGTMGSKRRPAVVMSIPAFHQAGTKIIVAAITSNLLPPLRPGDTLLSDWGRAGLVKPSAVRGTLATKDNIDIVRLIGHLSSEDLANVEQGIATILGFRVP